MVIIVCVLADYVEFPSWGGQSGHRLEVMPQSKFSGVSGCSDAAVSQGSICSTPTPGDIIIGETEPGKQPRSCLFCCCSFKNSSRGEFQQVAAKQAPSASIEARSVVSLDFRRQGDIRRRPRLPSPAEEGGAAPHHQPQLLRRNQRPRNRTTDVKLCFSLSLSSCREHSGKMQKHFSNCLSSFLQDKGEVSICVRRHLLVLRGLSPLGPLHVSPDLPTLHPGALPGRAVHARKIPPHIFPRCLCVYLPMRHTLPSSVSDV